MSITTKRGDKGFTSLLGGKRVKKTHILIETLGRLDEFCSYLGWARLSLQSKSKKTIILNLEKDIFVIAAEIASLYSKKKPPKTISARDILRLENETKKFEKKIKINKFCLPATSKSAVVLDITRALSRHIERLLWLIKEKKLLKNNYLPIYFNRASDLIWYLARSEEKKHLYLSDV